MKVSPLAYEVAHCSAWDEDHKPENLVHCSPGNNYRHIDTSEPNIDNGKGWQTPKCQSYPQDLIIHLLCGPARVTKIQLLSHHYKIPTKVDIYVGILKESAQDLSQQSDDDTDTLIEFTRLGYIEFDDNARTQFRARELKSIKINADGEYIRLVVRNNHPNHLNVDNQVGLLTLIVLGQPLLQDPHSPLPSSLREDPASLVNESSSFVKSSSVSSDDDQSQIYELSASGIMELELQHWTSSLLHAESLAVQDESYQKAKVYKQLSDRLSHLLQLMVTFEQAKRKALDTRDYHEAERIKGDIGEIKLAAESMIKQENLRIMDDGQVLPLDQSLVDGDGKTTVIDQDDMYEDVIAKWTNFDTTTRTDNNPTTQQSSIEGSHFPPPTLSSSMSAKIQQRRQSQQIAAATAKITTPMPNVREDDSDEPDAIPEPMMDEERAAYVPAIALFGEPTVACVLDMKSKCRERGLRQIQQCMNAAYPLATSHALDQLPRLFKALDMDDDIDDLGAYLVNATLMMLQEAIMDARERIVTLTIQIWQQVNDFYLAANVDAESTKTWTLRAFSGVLRRTSDTNSTIRSNAVDLVLLLAHTRSHDNDDYMPILDQFICQPDRMIHNHKEALARVHLVQRALNELKLQQDGDSGLIVLDRLVAFTLAYLGHGHEDVQQQAMRLLLGIHSQVEWSTLALLLDKSTQQALQLKLQKKQGSTSSLSLSKDAEVAELRALTLHSSPPEGKKPTSRKSDTTTTNAKRRPMVSADKKKSQATTKKPSSNKRAAHRPTSTTDANSTKPSANTHAQEIPDETMCIFCDEVNEHFNEHTLIMHYYKDCPALTNCPMCQIIVEVSTLQSHTATDCEKRHLMKQCTRCKQSIPVEQWLPHTLKAACSAYTNSEEETRCPLCLVTIEPGTEEGWRRHLLTGGGCPKNPRGPQHLDNIITSTTTKKQQPSSDKKQHQSSSIRMKPSSLRKK